MARRARICEARAEVTAAFQDQEIVAGKKCYTRWEIKDLIVPGHVDIINPDVIKVGGLTELDRIGHLATCFQKPIQLHNTRPTISTAATMHALATFSTVARFVEQPILDGFDGLFKLFKNRVRIENGWLHLSEAPGHGLQVDEAAVRASAKPV